MLRAIEAMVPDLLHSHCAYRSMQTETFTGEAIGARPFKDARDHLSATGYLEWTKGWKNWGGNPFDDSARPVGTESAASTFRATESLITLAKAHGITGDNVNQHFTRMRDTDAPVVFVRESGGKSGVRKQYANKGKRRAVLLDDTTRHIVEPVMGINSFLRGRVSGIDFDGLWRGFNARPSDSTGSFDYGGRLYDRLTPSYQNLKGHERLRTIRLDDSPVVEIDVSASYLTIWHGVVLNQKHNLIPEELGGCLFNPSVDPYTIPGVDRAMVKLWFVKTWGKGKPCLKWAPGDCTNLVADGLGRKAIPTASRLYKLIVDKHPLLTLLPEVGMNWGDLMFLESEAILGAMRELMSLNVPSLPVHDALIVPAQHQTEAMEVISRRYEAICGLRPHLKVDGLP